MNSGCQGPGQAALLVLFVGQCAFFSVLVFFGGIPSDVWGGYSLLGAWNSPRKCSQDQVSGSELESMFRAFELLPQLPPPFFFIF